MPLCTIHILMSYQDFSYTPAATTSPGRPKPLLLAMTADSCSPHARCKIFPMEQSHWAPPVTTVTQIVIPGWLAKSGCVLPLLAQRNGPRHVWHYICGVTTKFIYTALQPPTSLHKSDSKIHKFILRLYHSGQPRVKVHRTLVGCKQHKLTSELLAQTTIARTRLELAMPAMPFDIL